MRQIVFYSGGICYAYIACRLKDEGHSPLCLFSDTKAEDIDTYRFLWEVARRWDLEVVEASDGRHLWEYFKQQNMIPARQYPACSINLKIKPSQKFLENWTEPGLVAYGYELGEEDRAERTDGHWKHPYLQAWYPLQEWMITKEQCFGYFNRHNVNPPRMYRHFKHANCLPCKNFRKPDWIALAYHYPERFIAARDFETESGLKWMQDGPYLRDLDVTLAPTGRRRKLAMVEPAFDFEMGCDRCALD